MENLLQFAIYRLSFILFCYMNCKGAKKLYWIIMEDGDRKVGHISNNFMFVAAVKTLSIPSTFCWMFLVTEFFQLNLLLKFSYHINEEAY